MSDSYASLPDLVIGAGVNVSNVLPGVYTYHDAHELMLYAVDGAYAETYTIEGNQDSNATNATTNWVTLNDGTADITPPAALKSKPYSDIVLAAGSIRLKANVNAAATRTWKVNKKWSAYNS